MKKPAKTAPEHIQARYREWVRAQLKDWDPRDDHFPGTYTPRYDGVHGDAVEHIEVENEPAPSDDV